MSVLMKSRDDVTLSTEFLPVNSLARNKLAITISCRTEPRSVYKPQDFHSALLLIMLFIRVVNTRAQTPSNGCQRMSFLSFNHYTLNQTVGNSLAARQVCITQQFQQQLKMRLFGPGA